jgi:hypothetical protein
MPTFIVGVEEEEDHEKSSSPTRTKLSAPSTPPPSELLKTIVRFVQVPFTFTGKGENQNARESPPFGVGCAERVKLALNVAVEPGPVTWKFNIESAYAEDAPAKRTTRAKPKPRRRIADITGSSFRHNVLAYLPQPEVI